MIALNINSCISHAYKVSQKLAPYLRDLVSIQPPRCTRSFCRHSSPCLDLLRRTSFSLKKILTTPFNNHHPTTGTNFPNQSASLTPSQVNLSHILGLARSPFSPASPSSTLSLFLSRLKTLLFHKSFPP